MPVNKSIKLFQENSPSILLDVIYRSKIKDIMSRKLITSSPKATIKEAKTLMKEAEVTGIPIVENNELVGMISIDDIFRAIDGNYMEQLVEDHMSTDVIVLEDDMPLAFGITYFEKFKYGRFPVIDKNKKLVGIITSRDILHELLYQLNQEVARLESEIRSEAEPDLITLREVYKIKKMDFSNAGKASNEIKKLLKERNFDSKLVRRVSVAAYELEINITIHSDGGELEFYLDKGKAVVIARDNSPGIEDVNKALKQGFSTADNTIKSLGFGAGMGLPNVKRVSDEFSISSEAGKGTIVQATIMIKENK
ncbi:MAG: CBS domain-containing protein [Candidatus Margulisbacteria bacterium]|nr:CBS domain-containing protein [Candidatus Margulisiibacteriota bacterium]